MTAVQDRRRANGPAGATWPPGFETLDAQAQGHTQKASRARPPSQTRKMYLKTGLASSASGSAYLEIEPVEVPPFGRKAGLKLTCTVHGPKPLPRSAPFSSQLQLLVRVKYAPFATRKRGGYIPDPAEKDLASQLETALRGALLTERWPKSGIDVVVTILESELSASQGYGRPMTDGHETLSTMNILASCVTVSGAAIADAGIDAVDMVSGGVAALVSDGADSSKEKLVLDPCPGEHERISTCCCVAYLQNRDELLEVWSKGEAHGEGGSDSETSVGQVKLIDGAIEAASISQSILTEALQDSLRDKFR